MENVKFKVLLWDPNSDCVEDYDVLPYFRNKYKESKIKPKTYDEFKQFVIDRSLCHFWSRCEYEIIITGWPVSKRKEKIDAHHQIKMNIDNICQILWSELQNNKKELKNN